MIRILSPGTRLDNGRYEISNLIDAGGMGHVYRASDTQLHRTVAIKVLPTDAARDPIRLQRFKKEHRLLAKFHHPRICAVHDVGCEENSDGDIHYLVMEFCEGDTLAERLKKEQLPFDVVLQYANEIAEGLAVAHKRGVVHRDLKPGNIKLTPGGVKLLDFGVAKLRAELVADPEVATESDDLPDGVTGDGKRVGTLPYMAPEQVEFRNDISTQADVWAFGAVLYEMMTGRKAFDGKTQNDVSDAILNRQPPAFAGRWQPRRWRLERLVRSCLAKRPSSRPRDGQELLDKLKAVVRQQKRLDWSRRIAGVLVLGLAGWASSPYLDPPATSEDGFEGFEQGKMNWGPHIFMERPNAVSGADQSSEQYRSGKASLKVDVTFDGPGRDAEVAVDKVNDPRRKDQSDPIDLSHRLISAYVRFPVQFPVVASRAPTVRLFLKDASEVRRSFYGCTEDVSTVNWIRLSLDTRPESSNKCRVGKPEMQPGFDPTLVQIIGIQVTANSEAPLTYVGHFFLDDVQWISNDVK